MLPGFRQALDAIKADRPQLRLEYARLAMEAAIPSLVDTMIEVGQTDKRDAQRARERILETVGVLQSPTAPQLGIPGTVTDIAMRIWQHKAEPQAVEAPVVEAEVKVLPEAEAT